MNEPPAPAVRRHNFTQAGVPGLLTSARAIAETLRFEGTVSVWENTAVLVETNEPFHTCREQAAHNRQGPLICNITAQELQVPSLSN